MQGDLMKHTFDYSGEFNEAIQCFDTETQGRFGISQICKWSRCHYWAWVPIAEVKSFKWRRRTVQLRNLGYLESYTADKIKRPRVKEKQVECFTPAEQKKIEQAVLTDKRPKMFGVILCLYTGLRIGELLALEWSDIDFSKGELILGKTCHYTKTENGYCRVTDSPKTQTSRRVIRIPR